MKKPARRSWAGAVRPPLRCQPWKRWLGKSLRPPGRGSRKTCSRSGEEAASAPLTAGSSGPRTAARSRTAAMPEPISKRRSGDVVVRQPISCQVEQQPERLRGESRADEQAAGRTGSDVRETVRPRP